MKTSNEQLIDGLKRDLRSQYKERLSVWDNIHPQSIDVKSYLDKLLSQLEIPFTINQCDYSSTVRISEYITIAGQYDPKDLKATFYAVVECNGETFTSNIFIDWVPIIYIQEYLPLLKRAIAQLNELSNRIMDRLKAHRKSELLYTLIMSKLEELRANQISKDIRVNNYGKDSFKVGYALSSNLDFLVTASFENYITQIDLLVEKISNAPKIKNIKTLRFITVPHYDSRRYIQGRSKGQLWRGEPRKMQYTSNDILASDFTELKNNLQIHTLRNALEECGYKYYNDEGLYIILNENVRILRLWYREACRLSRNNKTIGKEYDIKEADFIIVLRIIAALPPESIDSLANSCSFEQLIENLFAYEICKYLLPEYCSFRYQPVGRDLSSYYSGCGLKPDFWQTGDIIVFPSNDYKDSIALLIPHQKRYFRSYFTVLTNLEVLHNLLTDKCVSAQVTGLTDEDVIHDEDKRAIDIVSKHTGAEDLSETFKGYKAFSINLTDFNTANAITMREMFKNCSELQILDVSAFNTSNVVDMSSMFEGCLNLKVLDLSDFDTAKISAVDKMFYNCFYLTHLNLSGWNLDKLQQKKSMFEGCNELKTIIMRGCNDETVNLIKTQLAADSLTGVEIITE